MEAVAVATQQAILQSHMGTAMVKQQAKAEQAIVEMIAKVADENKGRNLDILV